MHSIDWALEWMIFTREIKKATIKRMIWVNGDRTESSTRTAHRHGRRWLDRMQKRWLVIAHANANGGSCCQSFVKNLVDAAARVASALQITRLDINYDVRRILSKSAAVIVQREVSPYESCALLEPSTTMMTTIPACAASDTLSLMSSNAEENTIQELQNKTPSSGLLASSGLNLLASAAAESNSPKLPNRCSYSGCGAPICLVSLDCNTPNCTGKVHPFCQVFAGASGSTMFPPPSEVKCRQCTSSEPNPFSHLPLPPQPPTRSLPSSQKYRRPPLPRKRNSPPPPRQRRLSPKGRWGGGRSHRAAAPGRRWSYDNQGKESLNRIPPLKKCCILAGSKGRVMPYLSYSSVRNWSQ